MREQRYLFQGGIVLLVIVANMICSGVLIDLIQRALPQGATEPAKLGLQIIVGVILAIAISPSLGYLIYTMRHSIFLLRGGWAGLYKRYGIKTFIDKCPDIIPVKDLDVKASLYLCMQNTNEKYVEWIRRRMDAYFISTSIALEVVITNLGFLILVKTLNVQISMNRQYVLWVIFAVLVVILLYIAIVEMRKGVEGFKIFFYKCSILSDEALEKGGDS